MNFSKEKIQTSSSEEGTCRKTRSFFWSFKEGIGISDKIRKNIKLAREEGNGQEERGDFTRTEKEKDGN